MKDMSEIILLALPIGVLSRSASAHSFGRAEARTSNRPTCEISSPWPKDQRDEEPFDACKEMLATSLRIFKVISLS